MPLRRRLLGLSAGLRRSLATAATHPPWAMFKRTAEFVGAPSRADVRLAEPPHVSELCVPERLVKTRGSPDPDSDVVQSLNGGVSAASGDGLLLLSCLDLRFILPGAARVRHHPSGLDPTHVPCVTRLVCNPLTRGLRRLPDSGSDPVDDVLCGPNMGILTQADRGHGGPDRFAVALPHENLMLRFLSETGEWDAVPVSPCQLPSARRLDIDQEALAFGGRLWWVDLAWGAISADPFSDRPELSFVELPRGSVLPEGVQKEAFRRGSPLPDAQDRVWWKQAPVSYRRVGVSEGRLWYVEVSHEEPFLLRSFVLDDEGTDWTLEHRVVLNKLWGSTMGLPLQERGSTRIVLIDPLSANVVYLTADRIAVVAVDMDRQEVIGCYPYRNESCMPCVLPPWLRSIRIPSAGKKYADKNKTLADVLVRSHSH